MTDLTNYFNPGVVGGGGGWVGMGLGMGLGLRGNGPVGPGTFVCHSKNTYADNFS